MLSTSDPRFKIFVVGVGEEIAHEELAQLPTDHSLLFSADNDDLLKALLNDAADYGCTGKRKSGFYHRILQKNSQVESSIFVGNQCSWIFSVTLIYKTTPQKTYNKLINRAHYRKATNQQNFIILHDQK